MPPPWDTVAHESPRILFNVPFLGPHVVETALDQTVLHALQAALMNFGLGCQLLDDIRDLARDLTEGRHNYVLSWLAHSRPRELERLSACVKSTGERLYLSVPGPCAETARLALSMMTESLTVLGRYGLGFRRPAATHLAEHMLAVLDLRGLQYAT